MKTKEKWYNNYIVGYLLIFCPPIGLYGVYKSDIIRPKWKKATYKGLSLAVICGVVLYLN